MDNKPRLSAVVKRCMVAVSVAVVAAVLIVSALMLVKNARLQQTSAPTVISTVQPELRVVPSVADGLTTTSGSNASSTLQGSTGAPNSESNELPATGAVKVEQLPPVQERVCNAAKKAQIMDAYALSKASENSYHGKLLGMLRLESILLQTSEQTRHVAELTKLDSNLTKSLSAIFCS